LAPLLLLTSPHPTHSQRTYHCQLELLLLLLLPSLLLAPLLLTSLNIRTTHMQRHH
jgi:hypothetical protein